MAFTSSGRSALALLPVLDFEQPLPSPAPSASDMTPATARVFAFAMAAVSSKKEAIATARRARPFSRLCGTHYIAEGASHARCCATPKTPRNGPLPAAEAAGAQKCQRFFEVSPLRNTRCERRGGERRKALSRPGDYAYAEAG
jgi:hypothetical protein